MFVVMLASWMEVLASIALCNVFCVKWNSYSSPRTDSRQHQIHGGKDNVDNCNLLSLWSFIQTLNLAWCFCCQDNQRQPKTTEPTNRNSNNTFIVNTQFNTQNPKSKYSIDYFGFCFNCLNWIFLYAESQNFIFDTVHSIDCISFWAHRGVGLKTGLWAVVRRQNLFEPIQFQIQ